MVAVIKYLLLGKAGTMRTVHARTAVGRLVSMAGYTAAVTLLGACGGTGPAATPAKSTPPTSSATTATASATTDAPTPLPAITTATLASFADTWYSPQGLIKIELDGHGHLDYPDFSHCQECSMSGAPRSTMDFTLQSVSNGVASGSVAATSNPENATVGGPVTAKLVPVTAVNPAIDSGEFLQMTMGKMNDWLFCNNSSRRQC
jgi:hypothetical protein